MANGLFSVYVYCILYMYAYNENAKQTNDYLVVVYVQEKKFFFFLFGKQ